MNTYTACIKTIWQPRRGVSKQDYWDFWGFVLLIHAVLAGVYWYTRVQLHEDVQDEFLIQIYTYTKWAIIISVGFHFTVIVSATSGRLHNAGFKRRLIIFLFVPVVGWFVLLLLLIAPARSERRISSSSQKTVMQTVPLSPQQKQSNNRAVPTQSNFDLMHHTGVTSSAHTQNNNSPTQTELPSVLSVLWIDAYTNTFTRWLDFQGRTSRKTFWLFILFTVVFSLPVLFLDGVCMTTFTGYSGWVFTLFPQYVTSDTDLSFSTYFHELYRNRLPVGWFSLTYAFVHFVVFIPTFIRLTKTQNNTKNKS